MVSMKGSTLTNGVEASYKNAVARAYDTAAMKAGDVRAECGPAPIDHAAQAALENSELTGARFETAYGEIFQSINTLSQTTDNTDELADKLQQIRVELLRVAYEN